MKKLLLYFVMICGQQVLFSTPNSGGENNFSIEQYEAQNIYKQVDQLYSISQEICRLHAENEQLFSKKLSSIEVGRYHTVLATIYKHCLEAGRLLFECRKHLENITDSFTFEDILSKLTNLETQLPARETRSFCRDIIFKTYLSETYTHFGAATAIKWAQEIPYLAPLTTEDDVLLILCQDSTVATEYVEELIEQLVDPLGCHYWASKKIMYQVLCTITRGSEGKVGIKQIEEIIQSLQIKDRSLFSQVEFRRQGINPRIHCNDPKPALPIEFKAPYNWRGRTVFVALHNQWPNDELHISSALFFEALRFGHLAREIKNWYFTQTKGKQTNPDYKTLVSELNNLLTPVEVDMGTTLEDATELICMLLQDNPPALEAFLNNPEELLEETRWCEGKLINYNREKPYPISRILEEVEKLHQQFPIL